MWQILEIEKEIYKNEETSRRAEKNLEFPDDC